MQSCLSLKASALAAACGALALASASLRAEIPTYTNIGVTGSFNLPSPWNPHSDTNVPPTAMHQESTNPDRWILDYKFTTQQLGAISFKFISTGSSDTIRWGRTNTPGSVILDGNNISAYVQATGFYRFTFDLSTMTYTFVRRVFDSPADFLAAYGLAAGVDSDGDGILNEDEFTANTDPTNRDSDGDDLNGTNNLDDLHDPQPLRAVRDIVFSVNMHIQIVNGALLPGSTVKVSFAPGADSPADLVLSDPDGDDIYTGTLTDVPGKQDTYFGDYQFYIEPANPNDRTYEYNFRNFKRGLAHTTQILPVVFFNDTPTSNAYIGWASNYFPYADSPTADPDTDGHTNYQEFLFGTSPLEPTGSFCQTETSPAGLVIHWLQRSTGVRYWLEENTNPATQPWSLSPATIEDDPDQKNLPADGSYIRKSATIPIDPPHKFLRIAALE